jgi:F-type H+-transporting ATPase subunit b
MKAARPTRVGEAGAARRGAINSFPSGKPDPREGRRCGIGWPTRLCRGGQRGQRGDAEAPEGQADTADAKGAGRSPLLSRKVSAIFLVALACGLGGVAHADVAVEVNAGGNVNGKVAPRDSDRPRSLSAAEEAPTGEEAPAHGTPQLHPKSLAFQLFNFGVLLFVLIKFGGPAISKALAARHEQLKAELAAAAAARAAAEARLAQQEQRLAALEQEIVAIRAGVKQEAEAEKARLIALGDERARRIREETSFVLDQQIKEAEVRLRREVGLAAIDLAEQLVRRSFDARDQERLVDAFVDSSVGTASPPGSGH